MVLENYGTRRGIMGSLEFVVKTVGQNCKQPEDLGLVTGISNGDSRLQLSSLIGGIYAV